MPNHHLANHPTPRKRSPTQHGVSRTPIRSHTRRDGSEISGWTDEEYASLRALWAEGLSAREIGLRLGRSKNSVISRAHHLDLKARPSPNRGAPKAAPAARPNARSGALRVATVAVSVRDAEPDALPPMPAVAAPPVHVVPERPQRPVFTPPPGECRFILDCGLPCDAPTELGKPYCLQHCRLCFVNYRPLDQQRAEAANA